MRTIWKYKLDLTEKQTIQIPQQSKLLCVNNQYDYPTLWFEVNNQQAKMSTLTIQIVGTGQKVPEDINSYLGTVFIGEYVWHLYSLI